MARILNIAAAKGDFGLLSEALNCDHGSYTDEDMNNALHQAASQGNLKCVNLLLRAGADAQSSDIDGETPVKLAVNNGYGNIAKLLLSFGGSINAQSHKGRTPLHSAAWHGYTRLVKFLLQEGAQVDYIDHFGDTALMNSASKGHMQILEILVKQTRILNKFIPNELNIALHHASKRGHTTCVKYLLNSGADINWQDEWQQSPLMHAASRNEIAVLKLLLDRKCDVNLKSVGNYNALCYAVQKNNTECTQVLLEHGAQFDTNGNPVPLLQTAIQKNNINMTRALIQAGCLQPLGVALGVNLTSCEVKILRMLAAIGHNHNTIRACMAHLSPTDTSSEMQIWCEKFPYSPPSLQELCRMTMVSSIRDDTNYKKVIEFLPLPSTLKLFLLFCDFDHF